MTLQKIGAVWKKKAQKTGVAYLSGNIEVVAGIKQYIKILPYTTKEGTEKNANAPDYNILLQLPDKESVEDVKEEVEI
jgi:hypothetical protein